MSYIDPYSSFRVVYYESRFRMIVSRIAYRLQVGLAGWEAYPFGAPYPHCRVFVSLITPPLVPGLPLGSLSSP